MIENPEIIPSDKQLYVFTNTNYLDICDSFKDFPVVIWREGGEGRIQIEDCLYDLTGINKVVVILKDRLAANWLNNYLTLGSLNPGRRKRWAAKLGLKNITINKRNTVIFNLKEKRLNEIIIGDYGCIFLDLENKYEEATRIYEILSDKLFHQNIKL
jgi:hypothetical protein